jgi:hypothetical protein
LRSARVLVVSLVVGRRVAILPGRDVIVGTLRRFVPVG